MMKKTKNGFSLIELSIVILIASIFASSMINILGKKTLVDKNTEAKEKLARIGEALKVYYGEHGDVTARNYLPCPADLRFNLENADLGRGSSKPCSFVTDTDGATNVISGAVPVLELGLAPQYMFDPWGNQITYIVDKDLTADSETAWTDSTISNISLLDGRSTPPTPSLPLVKRLPLASELNKTYTLCDGTSLAVSTYNDTIPDCPAFLLISHGANGYLSFNSAGIQKQSSFGMTPNEIENNQWKDSQNFNNVFVSAPLNQDTKVTNINSSSYFDDILYYKSMSYFTGETPAAGTCTLGC